MKILCVFGTRPEAIKMAPVVQQLREDADIDLRVCVTGQHRQMLDQVLEIFDIRPDDDLNIMQNAQSLESVTRLVLEGVTAVLRRERVERVLVQGDTTTVFAAALAAFYEKIPVGHVEAGLRTGDIFAPWPEEMNRRLAGTLSDMHFAPTEGSRQNLLAEGISQKDVFVTGNTVIDALLQVVDKIESDEGLRQTLEAQFPFLDAQKKMILVTGHRRENFEGGLHRMCEALRQLAQRGDVQLVYPVHLNPQVQKAAQEVLKGADDVHLISPQDYLPFVFLMSRSYMIITDSGGVQEEAPSLGKPVLVTREKTERPEAVAAGTVRLVGTDVDAIVKNASELLDNQEVYEKMSRAHNPYGDGKASQRIVAEIKKKHNLK